MWTARLSVYSYSQPITDVESTDTLLHLTFTLRTMSLLVIAAKLEALSLSRSQLPSRPNS